MPKGPPCTANGICIPSSGASWTQDDLTSVIWNPKMTYPFDQYDKVDIYIVDDSNSTRVILLQKDVDLSTGMMAAKLDAPLFPNDTPLNRSCHIVMVGNGNAPDGTHQTLNSTSFYLIRTKELVSGTLVPVTGTPTTSTLLATSTIAITTSATLNTTMSSEVGGSPTNLPSVPEDKHENALSPLVIGLISAACVILMIAVIAIGLLFRTQRRSKGTTGGHFKSLHDQPSSPTDDTSKSSLYKGHELTSEASFIGPVTGSVITTGRSSSTTARSADPMVKGAPSILGLSNQSPTSPVAPMPLLERKPSTHNQAPEPVATAGEGPSMTTGDLEEGLRPQPGSALSAGDAQLIADTFRKSMRRPRWEENDADEEEQDEARRAANQLLREELSEQGLDVRRGVQRRVTIQDRVNRQSVPAPISHTDA
ncbi:hypothetical protein B0O80DRAFT_503963 [Mortierella sp. GBAus27b]|nr:hypothetical protein BGX31_001950 [Mortierella sp. GBA43]KAI8345899.1 hypothetical protein B0O80DRAFT_503963 [Mortierella sp. GBAus27b]